MEYQENLIETDLIIDSSGNMHLKETAIWAKFLGIMGFVYSGLIALGAIFAGSMLAKFSGNNLSNSEGILAGGSVAIIYLGMATVVFFMSLFLFRFARKIQFALQSNDQVTLNESFKNLKIYFRFAGVITVIALIFSVLGIVGILLATAFNR